MLHTWSTLGTSVLPVALVPVRQSTMVLPTTGLYLYCRYCSTTVAIALYEYHCFRHSLAWLATDVSFLTALLSLV